MSFWNGFIKAAQEMLKWNALGGIEPSDPEAIARAQQAELKTLAQDVEGANCANCKWSRPLPDETFLCNKPEVMMEVTPRMLCALWENPGSIYAGSGEDNAKQQQELAMQEEAGQMDQAGAELGLDEQDPNADPAAAGAGGEQAPAEGEAASAKETAGEKPAEKPAGKDSNKITINVGHKGDGKPSAEKKEPAKKPVEKKANLRGFLS